MPTQGKTKRPRLRVKIYKDSIGRYIKYRNKKYYLMRRGKPILGTISSDLILRIIDKLVRPRRRVRKSQTHSTSKNKYTGPPAKFFEDALKAKVELDKFEEKQREEDHKRKTHALPAGDLVTVEQEQPAQLPPVIPPLPLPRGAQAERSAAKSTSPTRKEPGESSKIVIDKAKAQAMLKKRAKDLFILSRGSDSLGNTIAFAKKQGMTADELKPFKKKLPILDKLWNDKKVDLGHFMILAREQINEEMSTTPTGTPVGTPRTEVSKGKDEVVAQAGEGKSALHSKAAELPVQRRVVEQKGLSNHEIDKIMSKYPEYIGTIAHNEIPLILPKVAPKSRGGLVINLDSASLPGSHWVALFWDARPPSGNLPDGGTKSIEYFDSYGEMPDKKLLKGIKDIAKKLQAESYLKFKVNLIKFQSDSSPNCGFFATKFLIDRFRDKPFIEASGFNSQQEGEGAIKKFKTQVGYPPEAQKGSGRQSLKTPGGYGEWKYIASFA